MFTIEYNIWFLCVDILSVQISFLLFLVLHEFLKSYIFVLNFVKYFFLHLLT